MSSKPEIAKRREEMIKLRSMGLTLQEISNQRKTPIATVRRDMAALKIEMEKELDKGFLAKIQVEMLAGIETATKELWKIYAKTERESIKVKILDSFVNVLHRKTDIMKNLGMILSQPQVEVTQQFNVQQFLKEFNIQLVGDNGPTLGPAVYESFGGEPDTDKKQADKSL